MTLATLLTVVVLVFALPLNWLVTVRLWWRSRSLVLDPGAVRERAIVALALTLIVTVFALIFANNDLPVPILNGDATKLITRGAVLALSVIPALYWLWLDRDA